MNAVAFPVDTEITQNLESQTQTQSPPQSVSQPLDASITEVVDSEYKTLPSGRRFTIREGVVEDLIDAQMMSQGKPAMIVYYLIAILCKIDGKAIFVDEIKKMNMRDGVFLLNEVNKQLGESQE